MKRIDELALLEDQFSKEQKRATLIMLILQAIENVEKLIEGNPESVSYTHLTLPTIYSV